MNISIDYYTDGAVSTIKHQDFYNVEYSSSGDGLCSYDLFDRDMVLLRRITIPTGNIILIDITS